MKAWSITCAWHFWQNFTQSSCCRLRHAHILAASFQPSTSRGLLYRTGFAMVRTTKWRRDFPRVAAPKKLDPLESNRVHAKVMKMTEADSERISMSVLGILLTNAPESDIPLKLMTNHWAILRSYVAATIAGQPLTSSTFGYEQRDAEYRVMCMDEAKSNRAPQFSTKDSLTSVGRGSQDERAYEVPSQPPAVLHRKHVGHFPIPKASFRVAQQHLRVPVDHRLPNQNQEPHWG